jgi:hypothetical protein
MDNELNDRLKSIEDNIKELNAIVAGLSLSFDNIYNSAEFVDGYQNQVNNMQDDIYKIKKAILMDKN